jgi:hypothetical protein
MDICIEGSRWPNMKEHILHGLQEQVERWERFLAGLTEAHIVVPRPPSEWSLKDEIAHSVDVAAAVDRQATSRARRTRAADA